jgi:DNA polymerase-3 subunit epsilon
MNLIFVYDTETSGLPNYSEPSESPDQPHIVEISVVVIDVDTRMALKEISHIVKPDGWVIPQEVIDIHGITNEMAEAEGIPEEEAIQAFFDLWGYACDLDPEVKRTGFSETFDRRMIRIATKRIPRLFKYEGPWHDLEKDRSYCCMHKSKQLVGALSDKGKVKNPKLGEAFEHFAGKPMENAHRAMPDVLATIAVFFGIKDSTCC